MFPAPRRSRLAFASARLATLLGLPIVVTLSAQTVAPTAADDDVSRLPEFVVDTSRDVGYQTTNTASVSHVNRPLKDIPQSISILNQELMRDVGALDFSQAVQYSTNINFQIANADTNFTIRGLTSRSFFVNFLTRVTPTDSYMTERIEVVHGPASVIYGQQDAGGVVNTITKRAHLNQNRTELEYTVGNYGLQRGTLDANIALKKNQAVRVAALYNVQDNARKFAELDRRGIYASYLWDINPTTSFHFMGESGYDHRTPFTGIVTLQENSSPQSAAANLTLLPREYAQSAQGPDARSNLDYFFYTGGLTKALFDNRLNIELTMSESMRNRNQRWGPTMKALSVATVNQAPAFINGYQITPGYTAGTPVMSQTWQWVGLDEHFRFYRLQAAWQLPDVAGKHMLTFGGTYEPNDFPTEQVGRNLYLTPPGSPRGTAFGTANNQRLPYTSLTGEGMRYPYALINNGLWERSSPGFILGKIVKAGFAMLASDWGQSGRFKTLIGFRYDDMFNSNTRTAPVGNTEEVAGTTTSTNHVRVWSKSIGAVYAITPTINATVNYGTSLWPNVNQFDTNLNLMPPTSGESWEAGLKALSFDGRLSASITFFDMKQQNSPLAVAAPLLVAEFGSATPSRSVAGSMRSRGFEIETVANPSPNWTLRAGIGYADPEITTDLPQFGYPKGKTMPGVTKLTGTFFTRYTFTDGPLRGAFVGSGFNLRGRNYAGYIDTDNDNIADQPQTFDGYTTFDFLAGYSFKLGHKVRATIRANVRNVFDKEYIVATDINFAGYGDARQFMLSTAFEF